ncbi:MAG TPA: TIGR03087 family PEP-CTERM/XrtA system glycosyltransferase [Sphingomonas sp.]|jgi:sugar transferase (PEP-CTERM/EpsH1 system associated)|nr:TIGR03087 family PEP-CTERM/XrtA system glycosyltransferase [Sphingomonas sp.]
MDILFVAHRLPWPPDRGDKIRSHHIVRHLAQRARVHVVAFADDAVADAGYREGLAPYVASLTIVPRRRSRAVAAALALIRGQPVLLPAFEDAALRAAVDEVIAREAIEAIYLFSVQMAQYLPAQNLPYRADARIVMDFVDFDSAKYADYGQRTRGVMGWVLRREARLLLAYERAVAARAEASVFVSADEAAMFARAGGGGRVQVIENGIDTAFYDPALAVPVSVADGGPLIVFTGQMDYRPNIEAMSAFVADILPLVRSRHPGARLAIVGRAPTAAVRALAGEGVIVTGAVEDVRGWLAAAAVCVAPLATARGVQNKVLEAMAMARAVVASTAAAEGIDHDGTIRVAGDTQEFAAAVAALIDAPGEAAALGAAARARVIARYAWAARLAPLDDLLGLGRAAL